MRTKIIQIGAVDKVIQKIKMWPLFGTHCRLKRQGGDFQREGEAYVKGDRPIFSTTYNVYLHTDEYGVTYKFVQKCASAERQFTNLLPPGRRLQCRE